MNAIPLSLLPDTAAIDSDGELTVGGVRLTDMARDYGTAVFVYDQQHLENRCREAVAAFPNGVAYASKAFLCVAMARVAYEAGMRIDVASGGELHVALQAGFEPERIYFHGNNKSEDEIAAAVDLNIGALVVDSFDEIDRLERVLKERPPPHAVRCWLRVRPGVEVHTFEANKTGQEDSKFGFGLANGDAEHGVDRLRSIPNIELTAVHAHFGSLVFETTGYKEGIELMAPFVLKNGFGELCIGGGLGVAYVTGESAPTLTEWAADIHAAIAKVGLSHVAVSAEPGRSIVAGASVTLYRVGTIKEIPGIRTYLSVDGGMSDNPRPILYGSGYEAFLPRSPASARQRTVTITGKHCESGDFLIKDAEVPEDTSVGDILATPATGAYGYALSSTYNKVPRPPVVFVKDGVPRTVLRRETYDDLLRLDVS